MTITEVREALLETALAAGALRVATEAPFRWVSGYYMPIYNDNRRLMALPEGRRLVKEGFLRLIEMHDLDGDAIAGTASAGIAPATLLAEAREQELYYVRSSAKGHGMERRIEGASAAGVSGMRVILVEDLVSTGGSSGEAAAALLAAGASVPVCLSIFSYSFPGAAARFAALPGAPPVLAICTMDDLIRRGGRTGEISARDAQVLTEWIADPFGWGERHGFQREVVS